ncbi:hypothetical protein MELA_02496 [Candidatus Methylomirabilis lanthanidiphila]|uniref:DUF2130 domain-containing protein n=1 Tax=Candidatus Methylomirabilis lanthanidiphila TaxID=2211376 RepID=A0A564ZL86_9BACT|nr:DUF2130 domain-containing protein [Candidatus Methylomirabilis lanthanidiphila]VUZ86100.1 hypothetical protein MELA_02496 [Candidatus Methylomirabilis lanthanidiphila]
MIAPDTIACPHCGAQIPLTEALRTHMREDFEQTLHARLAEERAKALAQAKADLAIEHANLTNELTEKATQLEDSRTRELALLKKARTLEDEKAALDLELERRLQAERATIEETVETRLAEQHRLRDLEKDKQLGDLRRQIEDLKRKAEQGSQQTQGEAAELDLEAMLRTAFPQDEIAPVPKGIRGADVIQRVISPGGRACGCIVWEAKNTKAWSDGWLEKLRDDRRELKADVAALATTVLPKDVKHLALMEGVWVTDFAALPGLATALRSQLIQVASARAAAQGRGTKMEQLYDYLTGTDFRQRVEAIAEAFVAMKADLDRERRAVEKIWAARDKQLGRALSGLAGMYGDMQGLVGASLPKVAHLELGSGDGQNAAEQPALPVMDQP